MNCRKIQRRLLMKYFDGNMTGIDQEQLKRHLDSCQSCRDCFTDLQEILGSLATNASSTLNPDLPRRIMDRIKQAPLVQALPVKASSPAPTPAGSFVSQIPILLLLLITVALGLNLRNTGLFDLVERAGQIINQCSGALIIIQNIWSVISRLFPSQISGVIYQFQWVTLVVIIVAFTLLARNIVLKLKTE